jgi:hypothetical protein
MATETEQVEEIRASQDFEKLEQSLKELIRQPCLRANQSYGGAFEIHFGEAKPYLHPKLADMTRGSWVLELPGTPWAFHPTAQKGLFYLSGFPWMNSGLEAVTNEEMRASFSSLAGTNVLAIKATQVKGDLAIFFSNGATFTILSKYALQDLCTPAWELLTPHHTYFQVWSEPVPMWSLLRSDLPQAS